MFFQELPLKNLNLEYVQNTFFVKKLLILHLVMKTVIYIRFGLTFSPLLDYLLFGKVNLQKYG